MPARLHKPQRRCPESRGKRSIINITTDQRQTTVCFHYTGAVEIQQYTLLFLHIHTRLRPIFATDNIIINEARRAFREKKSNTIGDIYGVYMGL